MAIKLVVIASLIAFANGGIIDAPVVATYSGTPADITSYLHRAPLGIASATPVISSYASPGVAIHAPTFGSSHQSVERSLGGAQSISHYSKAIGSAFSSVRKYDTRITNDALTVAQAPVVAYSAPVLAKTLPPVAYSASPALAYSSAQAVSNAYIHHAQPLLTKTVAPIAPVAAHAPIATYTSFNPLVSKTIATPLVTRTVESIPSPLAISSGPILTKTAYSPAHVVAHTTFTGLGTSYEW